MLADRELSRVVMAFRTELSLGTGNEQPNTSFTVAVGVPGLERQTMILIYNHLP